ncbi:hypothetical protein R1flu_005540 [Riccia fluitans]|uniref:Uncharacterized protein n=1 Tax=Riccia fluitans TaxID=41844 RepID=A0ABD1YTG4_9MARC
MLKDPFLTPNVAVLLLVEVGTEEAIIVKDYAEARNLTTKEKIIQLSDAANKADQKDMFVSSFVETIKQAQTQWIHMGSLTGGQGVFRKKDYKDWQAMVCRMFGRSESSYKEVGSIVCCSEKTYNQFLRFIDA